MAKTPVTLHVDGFKDREVLKVEYEFDQEVDKQGQLSGIPRGGFISITVKALNDGNSELLSWMIAKDTAKDGSIEFLETKTGKQMKTITFKGAYCVGYDNDWKDDAGDYEHIIISCKEFTLGSATYVNAWE